MSEAIRVEGDSGRELARMLRGLGGRVYVKVVRFVVARTSTGMRKVLVAHTPKLTGALRASYGKETRSDSRGGTISATMGVRRGYVHPKTGKKPMLYARRVDAKQGFADEGFEASVPAAEKQMVDEVGRGIERQAKRRG